MAILRPKLGLMATLLTLAVAPALADWTHLGRVQSVDVRSNGVVLTCPPAAVHLQAVNEHVVRVRLAPTGVFGRDHSWAVTDLACRGSITTSIEGPVEPGGTQPIELRAGALRILVPSDAPARLTITDDDARALVADETARGMAWQVNDAGTTSTVRVWQQLADGVAVYGLGEKSGGLDKNGRAWTMWNTDAGAYATDEDPLYTAIPFFLLEREGRFHGVFFDNPWRTSFDFGKETRGVLSFGADGGVLNYYVIAGPHPKDVIRRFTDLVGRLPLPPKWSLGYHQCRYSYTPEARVREVAHTFREKRIPCDALYFDIDYMDGYRCFTWHPQRFPDPAGLTRDLAALGFHTVAIIDPGIKRETGYAVYDAGAAIDAWVKSADGAPYIGRVWPGDCTFPDFTNPRVRAWWSDLYPPFINACGLDGVWNDMNEPANFAGPNKTIPLDCRFDNAGAPAPHRACHNIYGMQMARATYEGLRRARPGHRSFTLTRATYAGGQRYGAVWTGDNISSWAHLQMTIPMLLNMGVSGLPFVGPDIGGFVGGATPELYARWIQVGALYPFSRTHTACDNPDQEPWSFGPEVESVARTALERRYRWMPYLYTVFEEAARTGLPVMRPRWLENPTDRGWMMESSFLLGADIFVAPRLTPGTEPFWVQLPAGVWFDGVTGLIDGGSRWVRVPGDLHHLPHYFRGGSIIPNQSVVQHTGETPAEPLILDAWVHGPGEGTLYEDDGVSLAFEDGAFRRTRFTCRPSGDHAAFIMHTPQGSYTPPPRQPLLRLHGLTGNVTYVATGAGAGLDRMDEKQLARLAAALHQLPEDTPVRVKVAGGEVLLAVAHQAVGDGVPRQTGTFSYDRAQSAWAVRMAPDAGMPQLVLVGLKEPAASREPVVLDFDRPKDRFPMPRGTAAPDFVDGNATMIVRWATDIRLVLPRLAVPADVLGELTFRATSGHARRVNIRFASEADPATLGGEGVGIDLPADGLWHDYRIRLDQAAPATWRGRIYHVELIFTNGVQAGETIGLARVAFRPRDPEPTE